MIAEGSGLLLELVKIFWDKIEMSVVHIVKVVNTTVSSTLRWLAICHVDFTSV